jgi:hypothetical protein
VKAILAVITLALMALTLEDRARRVTGEAQEAYGAAQQKIQAGAADTRRLVKKRPLPAVLIAGIAGYGLSRIVPRL